MSVAQARRLVVLASATACLNLLLLGHAAPSPNLAGPVGTVSDVCTLTPPSLARLGLVPSARRSAISWRTRRPSGKARRGRILDVCNRGATQPDGMDRPPSAG